ncbi:ABC transporter ATP-binding protein [Dictyobacter arantiisoli]|uniref:ABC transporter ATP-binding protein n=1 Tax=Dictyobacter arantiisoli TaxID=2014874 RepID=A0A5A5T7D6_9CHLR|nr:ATP-binding cassette domain-containing protein [Dictyobacter arantiisoli]GCF07165.1 ABC transporter ATP-binding protein [Dictyobacter arantiisoli]
METAPGPHNFPQRQASKRAEVIVRTEGLTKRFDTFTAVDQLALEVYHGDVYGLLGPNGSGKTTTLRMLLGLIHPTAGKVTLLGHPMDDSKQRYQALSHVGAIIEQPVFYPFLTGRENLYGIAAFGSQPQSEALEERIEEMLELVDLATRARDLYSKYSLGMRQRLALAATLLHYPQLIILDEPTNGLDPAGVVDIRELIGQLARQGITVILSSHQLHEIQQVCSRVAIIKRGHLLVQGKVQDLLSEQPAIIFSFPDPHMLQQAELLLHTLHPGTWPWLNDSRIITAEHEQSWVPPGGQMLLVEATMEHAAELNAFFGMKGLYATEIRRHETSLEQYFLDLTTSPNPP